MLYWNTRRKDVKQEDYTDNLNKDHQDAEYLSTVRHVEENAENIDGKQRQYHCTDHADDNLLKIACRIFQYLTFQMSQANPSVKASTSAVITFIKAGYPRKNREGCLEIH